MDAIEYAMHLSGNLYDSLYMFGRIAHLCLGALIVLYLFQKMLEAATAPRI